MTFYTLINFFRKLLFGCNIQHRLKHSLVDVPRNCLFTIPRKVVLKDFAYFLGKNKQ